MNEQTTKLIEELAQKLGTTAEYLWAVLIKQAPISAMTDLLFFILASFSGILLYKLHKWMSEKDIYEDYEDIAIAPMIVLTILWGIIWIVFFFSLGNVITGFLNPEYWALKEVLDVAK